MGIAGYAFSGCTGLTSVEIPNSVTSIGDDAFSHCTGLTSVEIGDGVTSIGSNAFYDCYGLTSITIPNSVTSIGYCAFSHCTGLTSITIPNSVTSIGEWAFYGTAWDNNQPDGVVYAGKVLYGYKGTMPSNTSITIKDGTLGISGYAFSGCTGLTSVEIPNSLTSIGNTAFRDCTGLTSITIPNSVTSIGGWAFSGCTGLTSVEIPNSITSIESSAFRDCTGLTSITIPNSVTSIGDDAFSHCTGLTSITIPNSVTSIGDDAFSHCTGLTSVTIPNSVTSIGNYAFENCTGLKEVHISDLSAWCNISFGSSNANPLYYAKNLYLNNELITELTIPKSVTNIGRYAFYGCSGLTSIVIPNSVTSIGDYAFYGCTGLKTVINFSNLTFSKGSSNNGYVAYYADKVYNAPNGSFEGDFIFGKPNDVNTLVGYLGNATELFLPAGYNGENYAIGADAFQNYTGLAAELIIHNNITGIGASAFDGCNNIEKLYIGCSVESIGDKAFAGCEKITEIKVALEKPIRGSADIFADAVYDNATLYIPNGTEQLYQKREPWNIFFDIVEIDFTGIEDVEAEGEMVQTIYDLQGRKVEVPSEGLYIINGKKVMIK